MNRENKIKTI